MADIQDRRHALLDKKYGSGLNEAETEELQGIEAELDKADEEFYRPVMELLESLASSLPVGPEKRS